MFASDFDRAQSKTDEEINALLPLLPLQIKSSMLGGELGMAQVPSEERQKAQLYRILKAKASTDGSAIAKVRAMLRDVRVYAWREM